MNKKQNCPSTTNDCPGWKRQGDHEFQEALSTATFRAMDGLAIDDAVYRSALLFLQDLLANGCDDCLRRTIHYLHADLKWPRNRAFCQILVEDRLRKAGVESTPRVH